MAVLATAVVVGGTRYEAGTTPPDAVADQVRNGAAWVGGVAPALSATTAPTRVAVSDLADITRLRVLLGIEDPSDDPGVVGAVQKAQNLADLPDKPAARTNLGLGAAATRAVGTGAGDVAAGNAPAAAQAAAIAVAADKTLSNLTDTAAARTSLGLGNAATRTVGTGAGDVAAGDAPAAAQAAAIAVAADKTLSNLTDAAAARTALGLGNAATRVVGTGAGDVAAGNAPAAVQTAVLSKVHVGIPKTFGFIGDSTTVGGTDPIATSSQERLGNAWPTYATVLSGGRIRHTINAGNGGDKTDQMLAAFDTRVTPFAPKTVAILAGTNDISLSYAWTTTRDNIIALVAKVRDINAVPILCTIIPNSTGSPGDRLSKIQRINAWLRAYAAAQNIPLVDFHRVLVNPANGQFAAGMTSDNLHPSAAGHVAMAQEFNNVIMPLVPPGQSLLAHDTQANMLTNPLFLTDSSGLPTDWTAFGAGANMTNSIITGDTTILGNWAQIVVTDNTSRSLYKQVTTGYSIGDRLALCGKVQYTYVSGNGCGAGARMIGPNITQAALNEIPATFGPGNFYKEFNVLTGTTRIDVSLGCTNGTIKFAQVGLYNLTTLGLV